MQVIIVYRGNTMELTPSYLSKKFLIKRINKRTKNRIEEYTKVSTAFKTGEADSIKENLDSISRFAQRKHINLDFVPNVKQGGTKMKLYSREVTMVENPNDTLHTLTIPVLLKNFEGEATISNDLKTKKDVMETIREEAAKILYKK